MDQKQPSFTIKDSGERMQFDSGMVRDVTTDKTNVALVYDGPMFWRWAVHLTKGALKYSKRNWMKANGEKEYERFRESAARHFQQWYRGDKDEDHAAAVFFNINGAEYVKENLNAEKEVPALAPECYMSPELRAVAEANTQLSPSTAAKIFNNNRIARRSD